MWTGLLTDGLSCELLPAAVSSVCLTDDVRGVEALRAKSQTRGNWVLMRK